MRSLPKPLVLCISMATLTLCVSCASPGKVKKLEEDNKRFSLELKKSHESRVSLTEKNRTLAIQSQLLTDENTSLAMSHKNALDETDKLLREKAKLETENKRISILEKQLTSCQNKPVQTCPSNAEVETSLSKCEANLEKRQEMLDVCTRKKNQCITAFDKISKELK